LPVDEYSRTFWLPQQNKMYNDSLTAWNSTFSKRRTRTSLSDGRPWRRGRTMGGKWVFSMTHNRYTMYIHLVLNSTLYIFVSRKGCPAVVEILSRPFSQACGVRPFIHANSEGCQGTNIQFVPPTVIRGKYIGVMWMYSIIILILHGNYTKSLELWNDNLIIKFDFLIGTWNKIYRNETKQNETTLCLSLTYTEGFPKWANRGANVCPN
jgi:hypothetical protein